MGQIERLAERAREMRNQPTEPEKRLWRNLAQSRLGFKFRRQSVIGTHIVDFLCPSKALVVEVDGDTHDPDQDRRRDAIIASQGFRTIRFTNEEVMRNIDGVLDVICRTAAALPDRWPFAARRPHPNPSPEGEGLGDRT